MPAERRFAGGSLSHFSLEWLAEPHASDTCGQPSRGAFVAVARRARHSLARFMAPIEVGAQHVPDRRRHLGGAAMLGVRGFVAGMRAVWLAPWWSARSALARLRQDR